MRSAKDREPSQAEADCLYRNGEFTVGICKNVHRMESLHYFQSFLPEARDFSGARISGPRADGHDSERATLEGLGTPDALPACAKFCASKGFAYAALGWQSSCSCDNQFGDAGRAPDAECDVDGDGQPDCGTGTVDAILNMHDVNGRVSNAVLTAAFADGGNPPCTWRNAVYRLTPVLGGNGDVNSADTRYQGCYRDNAGQVQFAIRAPSPRH
jgi:hypothetical protein